MSIGQEQPKDLIESDWLDTYQKERDAILWQLVRLNSSLFVLEKISVFPFDLFLPTKGQFWQLVFVNFLETSVMVVWRLVDPRRKTLSLTNFVKRLRSHLKCPTYDAQLDEALQAAHFEADVERTRDRIEKIRHNQLAHLQRKWNVDPSPKLLQESQITLTELYEMRDALNDHFRLLCFGRHQAVLPWEYFPGDHTDIDELLNGIARNSAVFDMPEEQPDFWPHFRQGLSSDEVRALNRYRVKFGLSKV